MNNNFAGPFSASQAYEIYTRTYTMHQARCTFFLRQTILQIARYYFGRHVTSTQPANERTSEREQNEIQFFDKNE